MTSAQLRQEGNAKYKKAIQDGLSPVIKHSRLEEALKLYNQAAAAAVGPTRLADWSSATKNCGMATKRMAQEHRKDDKDKDKGYVKTLITFRESLKCMGQALLRGASAQGQAWAASLQEEMMATYNEISEVTDEFHDTKLKLRELYRVAELLPRGVVIAQAKYHISDVLFKESVRLLESGDYKESLRCLHDIHQPTEEALVELRDSGDLTEDDLENEELRFNLKILKQDAYYHMCTAESTQARKCGEALLKELLEDEETLNMDMVWNTVDWFKHATLKAAELDLEQEAAALSFLGLINEKILLSTTKTKLYYKKCLELVEAAKPKTFTSHEWYKQCVKGFKKIQDAERQRDEAEQQKAREKILDTLKDKIAALKKADTSASSLLEYLLKHHPPPKDQGKFTTKALEELRKVEGRMDRENQKTCKKLLLKAIQDFHPDKIAKAEGETDEEMNKRKVFVEEITKMITRHYEAVKLC